MFTNLEIAKTWNSCTKSQNQVCRIASTISPLHSKFSIKLLQNTTYILYIRQHLKSKSLVFLWRAETITMPSYMYQLATPTLTGVNTSCLIVHLEIRDHRWALLFWRKMEVNCKAWARSQGVRVREGRGGQGRGKTVVPRAMMVDHLLRGRLGREFS